MIAKGIRKMAILAIFSSAIIVSSHACYAQDSINNGGNSLNPGDLGGDVGDFDIGDIGGDTGGNFDNTGNNNTGGDTGNADNNGNDFGNNFGGGGGGTGTNPFSDLFSLGVDEEIPNDRRKAFVGPTNEIGTTLSDSSSDTGFVGPISESFGGGNGGGNRNFGGGGGNGGNVGGGQNQNQIIRGSVRTRLRPNFQARSVSPQYVSSQFQSQLQRLPSTQSYSQGVQIQVQNRTAVISGFVGSQAQADRIERQLRLQPGVYRIENRLTVGN